MNTGVSGTRARPRAGSAFKASGDIGGQGKVGSGAVSQRTARIRRTWRENGKVMGTVCAGSSGGLHCKEQVMALGALRAEGAASEF